MSSNSSIVAFKRPHHQTPASSFTDSPISRTGTSGHRPNVVKRARWDVSSPVPSPPILSVHLPPSEPNQSSKPFTFACDSSAFQFGATTRSNPNPSLAKLSRPRMGQLASATARVQKKPTALSTLPRGHTRTLHNRMTDEDDDDELDHFLRRDDAFSRLHRSTKEQGELFVERMREWERKQQHAMVSRDDPNGSKAEPQHPATRNNRGRGSSLLRGRPAAEQSLSSSSGSGSDVSSSRKRPYWSAIEDDELAEIDQDGAEMDWEVVLGTSTASVNGQRPIPFAQHYYDRSNATSANVESDHHVPCSSSSSQQGDIEASDDDYDDDDDLVFVLSHGSHGFSTNGDDLHSSTPALSPSTSILSSSSPHSIPSGSTIFPTSADRMLSDLTQAMDAGAGCLDGGNISDFVDVGYGKELGSNSGLGFDVQMGCATDLLSHNVHGVDAGAFWE